VSISRADRQQLERVVEIVREVIGDAAVGAYLFGSATLGGLQPESDLDVFVLTSRPTTLGEKQRLVEGLLAISGRETPQGRWRLVELTIVAEPEVKPWRYPPRMELQYGDWDRAKFEAGDVEPWETDVNRDLAVLITKVLLADAPLFGPPPAEAFDPVPDADAIGAMLHAVDGVLLDVDSDTRNAVLTLARIWSTLETGVIRSKSEAADWALARLPDDHRAILERARAAYLSDTEDWLYDARAQARGYAGHVAAEIRRASEGRLLSDAKTGS
jgi:streptomycin 3"-adenylyltransferase